eukprot:g77315.t1
MRFPRRSLRHLLDMLLLLLFFLSSSTKSAFALETPTAHLQERQQRLEQDILAFSANHTRASGTADLVVLAKHGIPLPRQELEAMAHSVQITRYDTADFVLVELLRILAFAPQYKDVVMPAVTSVPGLWLRVGDNRDVFWSENHFLMFHSCALIASNFGVPLPERWRERIVFFLRDKGEVGFYEFNSPTYYPFSLKALINLHDFAPDQEIKELARRAALRLAMDLIAYCTDKGTFYVATGRYTGWEYYLLPYGSDLQRVVAFLTGLGKLDPRTDLSNTVAFLATTSLDFEPAVAARMEHVERNVLVGHSIAEQRALATAHLSNVWDRYVSGWTMGMYFHPDTAYDTVRTIRHYELWNNHQFRSVPHMLRGVSLPFARFSAYLVKAVTSSSILHGEFRAWRHKDAVLSSMQNYFPGLKGQQQMPWLACTGENAIFTHAEYARRRGKWLKLLRRMTLTNLVSHAQLPLVRQQGNVALITYLPNTDLYILSPPGAVTLHWPEQSFRETAYQATPTGLWLIGAEGDSYIAVYRGCLDIHNGLHSCGGSEQTWASVVGHSDTHGSFSNFTSMIMAARVISEGSGPFLGRCLNSTLTVDGQFLNTRFCREATPMISLALGSALYAIVAICLSVFSYSWLMKHNRDRRLSYVGTCICDCRQLIGLAVLFVVIYPLFLLGVLENLADRRFPQLASYFALALIVLIVLHVILLNLCASKTYQSTSDLQLNPTSPDGYLDADGTLLPAYGTFDKDHITGHNGSSNGTAVSASETVTPGPAAQHTELNLNVTVKHSLAPLMEASECRIGSRL